ncbi:MAG: molybdopterin-dependent oxidoreductase [Alphaproteobacteria bacterium]|nr:molybdopterin-dependent oxidoreductase [Alphaproteobacteria bacterium]
MALRDRLNAVALSRRQLLTGAAVGGGLLVAWWAWPRSYAPALQTGADEHLFGPWLTVAADGVVTVAVPQLEMGQGVTTLLPQIVAQEMGAAWGQIAVATIPPSGAQANVPLAAKWAPLWSLVPAVADEQGSYLARRFAERGNFSATAEGSSVAAYEADCRAAGAAARAMLAMAAGERWGVAWEQCEAQEGFILHGEKRLRFGELAEEAAAMSPPDPPPLRPQPPGERPLAGGIPGPGDFPRLDLPAKVDGSFLFAADVRLPGMVHASIRHGPVGFPELGEVDAARAGGMGLVGLVRSKRWLAAVADSWWTAERALERIAPRFVGPGGVDSEAIEQALDEGLRRGEARRVASVGDPDAALAEPDMARRYDIAPAVHAAIETASATARLADGKLELWIASQAPEAARRAAAKAVGLAERDVVLYPMAAGGSFDARLEKQHAIEVAQIAQEIGRPVQLTWPRAEEFKALPPRTPVAALLTATLSRGEDRMPTAWRARLALPATMREFGERLFANATPEAAMARAAGKPDPLACEGAVPPYGIAHVAVDHVNVPLDLPTGPLRGNAAAYTGFATESFVDELAREARRDPYLYRMTMLGRDERSAEVLRRATGLGEWDGGGEGSRQGLALIRMQFAAASGSIACVAQAQLGQGGVRVARLSAVADIGRIVNLDVARQQIEGGLLFGLSLATGSSVTYRGGLAVSARLGDLGLPTLADAPEIVLDLVESDAEPFDPGELGVAVAPPAIANALFAATGVRFRRLPLLSEGI